ncbi:MAG: transcriptional repressor [Pseudomonadota bacterium]
MLERSRLSPRDVLATHGVRTTRQRAILAEMLFTGEGCHIDAQALHAEAARRGERLSLATVYNALRAFEKAGLIRRVAVPSERIWYDTDTGAHHHFYIEAENRVLDIAEGQPETPPEGYRIMRIDTVVHLEKVTPDE